MTTPPTTERKPKYYLRKSFNYDDWFCICQVANNVMVAEIPEREVAELLLEFLNDLPRGLLARYKKKAAYSRKHNNNPK